MLMLHKEKIMSYELNAMIYHKGKSISKEFNVNFLK